MYSQVLRQQIKNEQKMLQARINKQAKITLENIQIYRRILEQRTTFKTGGPILNNSAKDVGMQDFKSRVSRNLRFQSDDRIKYSGSGGNQKLHPRKDRSVELSPQVRVKAMTIDGNDSRPMHNKRSMGPEIRNVRDGQTITKVAIMEVRNITPKLVNEFKVSLQYCERPNKSSSPKHRSKDSSLKSVAHPRLGHLFHEKQTKARKPDEPIRGRASGHEQSRAGSMSVHSTHPTPDKFIFDANGVKKFPRINNKAEFKGEHRWFYDKSVTMIQEQHVERSQFSVSKPVRRNSHHGVQNSQTQEGSIPASYPFPVQPHSMILGIGGSTSVKPLNLFKKYHRKSAQLEQHTS
jgi:hypothetical protein